MTTEYNTDLIIEFVCRYANLQKQIKNIREDIKALKKEYNEHDLATPAIIKSFNELCKQKKNPGNPEIDALKEILSKSKDVDNAILDLI